MSNTDDPKEHPTQPAMIAVRPEGPRTFPTPAEMGAVRPLSIEERVALLESTVQSLQDTRPGLMAEIAAVKLSLAQGLAGEAAKRAELEEHITALTTSVAALTTLTNEQTPLIKAIDERTITLETNVGTINTSLIAVAKSWGEVANRTTGWVNNFLDKNPKARLAINAILVGVVFWLLGHLKTKGIIPE